MQLNQHNQLDQPKSNQINPAQLELTEIMLS